MKLELKYLAGYLPYGLKVAYRDIISHEDDTEFTMSLDDMEMVLEETEYFPILRPLSDLLDEDSDIRINFDNELNEFDSTYLRQAIVNKSFFSKDIHFTFELIEVLYKMHFDIHNLIERRLAININDLK